MSPGLDTFKVPTSGYPLPLGDPFRRGSKEVVGVGTKVTRTEGGKSTVQTNSGTSRYIGTGRDGDEEV